jgi:sugar lactone lactonase YvrE
MQHETTPHWQNVGDTLCASGESPFWHAQEERLYWVDTLLKRVWRHHPASGRSEHWDFPEPVTGLAPCRSGGLLLVMGTQVMHAGSWMDVPTPLSTLPASRMPYRLQGGRCDPWGRFWVSSMPTGPEAGPDSGMTGTLYCLPTRRQARVELQPVRGAVLDCHGWAWSPDGRFMVWCAHHRHEVEQAGMSLPGSWPPELGLPMTLARFSEADVARLGSPRSGAMDKLGRYWVAMAGGGRVLCIDDHGQAQIEVRTPTFNPTGLCFGGADMRTLFVTSSRAHRSAEELAAYPRSGGVFSLRLDAPGATQAVYWD